MNSMKKYAIYLITAMVILITTGCAEELEKDKFKYDLKYLAVSGVKLNKNTLTLSWNSRETLTAKVSPERADNRAITWSSSNDKIVVVNSLGELDAIGVGVADITVTTEDGGKTDVCKVTVNPYILLGETKLSLLVDEKVTLSAMVLPASYPQALTWTVENEEDDEGEYVTVSATGEITALADGKTTVKATITGTKLNATCAVTVGNVPVEKVELDKTMVSLAIGASETLKATVTPGNAWINNVEWKVKGTSISLTPNPDNQYVVTITRLTEGDAAVSVITVDGGKVATCNFPNADPNAIFFGSGTKIWTWNKLVWGPHKGDGWWNPSLDDVNVLLTDTYKSKDGKGATMTFSKEGLKLVKEKTDGSKVEGTFSVDMTVKTPYLTDWSGGASNPWGLGQLTTKNVTILWGVFLDHTKIDDGTKMPKDGNYPNGEADIEKVYKFDIIKFSDDEVVLAYSDLIHGDGYRLNWSGCWYWHFKPKQ